MLGRFDNSIKGTTLYKLAILTDDDVKTVTAARGRLFEEMHSSAETLNPETVTRDGLVAEVSRLEIWLGSIFQTDGYKGRLPHMPDHKLKVAASSPVAEQQSWV